MNAACRSLLLVVFLGSFAAASAADETTEVVDTSRGDDLLARYFEHEVSRIEDSTFAGIETLEDWTSRREEYHRQMMYMLGLDPLPERTQLNPVITGTIDHPEMTVENLHFQSMSGLYVTGNLYLPKGFEGPRPTILYVCGHGGVEIDGIHYGNKVHYQHHGEWFARHGYVCLTIDTIQLGEIQGLHHGNYREGMWWWYSRGYTPAGVEAWNCMRALDYLETRPEVDATKFGVTGRSGGGAYSWWIAAIDERIACAVPVAGITSLRDHVVNGCVEGHCDCMYMINTYGWDFPMVAALVAPRPLLISNTDKDSIFPLDGVYDVYTKVRRIYELYGAEDSLGLDINEGPHEDTQPLQVAAFEWMNRHLVGPDIVIERAATPLFTPPELRVFDQLPDDERVTTAHDYFVPMADAAALEGTPEERLRQTVDELMEVTFHRASLTSPDREPQYGEAVYEAGDFRVMYAVLFTDESAVPVYTILNPAEWESAEGAAMELHVLTNPQFEQLVSALASGAPELVEQLNAAAQLQMMEETLPDAEGWRTLTEEWPSGTVAKIFFAPRFVGPSSFSWDDRDLTHIRRRFMLIGRTLDSGRVLDATAAIRGISKFWERQLRDDGRDFHVSLHGTGDAALWCLYAGLLHAAISPDESALDRLVLTDLPSSHMDPDCPELLNVLRVTDIPQVVELLSEFREVELIDSAAATE